MSLAILNSMALQGLTGISVRVEVHVSQGLPAFTVVGLPNAGVRESRERVRSAILSSGFQFPNGRVTVNLAPADLPKASGRYDLAMALGVLLASGQLPEPAQGINLADAVFVGELSLTGAVVPIAGAIGVALAMEAGRARSLVLPPGNAPLAAQVPGVQVFGVHTLLQAVDWLSGTVCASAGLGALPGPPGRQFACLSDVRGQAQARRVLEVAASGGHSLLMCGPPGSGKSMLAQRLPGLLPLLGQREALQVAALADMRGLHEVRVDRFPPFRSPHHSASSMALVGGGAVARPGEISLAHGGVLFLDELPHYQRQVLESLREPLETGGISIARASGSVTFPALFQLVAAMNPCPCGWRGHARRVCRCSPDAVDRYRQRLSGPLLDRIDLQIALGAVSPEALGAPPGETSEQVCARVASVRARQRDRQTMSNARLPDAQLASICRMDAPGRKWLQKASLQWDWSARVMQRVLRVARTLADMEACEDIGLPHVAEAAQYRQPWPEAAPAAAASAATWATQAAT